MDTRAATSLTRELFREHGAAVYRFAVALGRHPQDAEDVVQETFLKLLQHLQGGGETSNIRGWIFTVAAHAGRDRQRQRGRWLAWNANQDTAVEPVPLPDEDGRQRVLRRALASLPDRDRLLLALRARGLSYKEIASAADVEVSSVGTFLARAVERCARAIDSHQGDSHAMSFQRADSGGR